MEKILISSCFLGNKVRYDGNHNLLTENIIQRWQKQQRLVVICPELAGGLPIPRPPAEIQYYQHGKIKVITNTGDDVTSEFNIGATEALRLCKKHAIRYALLKESSPSCGSSTIYDGSFSRQKITGQGMTASLLAANNISVYSEINIEDLITTIEAE